MKATIAVLILVFTGAISLYAQTDFRPGYVIKLSGDTIYGSIDYRGDILMSTHCKLQLDDHSIVDYYPDDITAFRFNDGRYFESRAINDARFFLEVLFRGRVSVFYVRNDLGDRYFIDKEGYGLNELTYKEEIKYVNGTSVLHKSNRHIGLLNHYMADAPQLRPAIQAIKKPEHQNLIKVARAYHVATVKDEPIEVFERKAGPAVKISVELIAGGVKFQDVANLTDKLYFQAGPVVHVWMPRVNEKLYFRTGLLWSKLEFATSEVSSSGESVKLYTYYKIPLHLEYIYPKGRVRPRASYGINLYNQNDRSVSATFGANVKINEFLSISATSEVEFNASSLILPAGFLSGSAFAGVVFNW